MGTGGAMHSLQIGDGPSSVAQRFPIYEALGRVTAIPSIEGRKQIEDGTLPRCQFFLCLSVFLAREASRDFGHKEARGESGAFSFISESFIPWQIRGVSPSHLQMG
jgi:hypothetical protein